MLQILIFGGWYCCERERLSRTRAHWRPSLNVLPRLSTWRSGSLKTPSSITPFFAHALFVVGCFSFEVLWWAISPIQSRGFFLHMHCSLSVASVSTCCRGHRDTMGPVQSCHKILAVCTCPRGGDSIELLRGTQSVWSRCMYMCVPCVEFVRLIFQRLSMEIEIHGWMQASVVCSHRLVLDTLRLGAYSRLCGECLLLSNFVDCPNMHCHKYCM